MSMLIKTVLSEKTEMLLTSKRLFKAGQGLTEVANRTVVTASMYVNASVKRPTQNSLQA